jgi:TPR repeat protein
MGALQVNPFNRQSFLITDISPNIDFYNTIKSKINLELQRRKQIIKDICIAATKDDIAKLQEILKSNPKIDINEDFKDGYTALHYACEHGKIKSVKWLLENGANLDSKSDKSNITPFCILNKKHPGLVNEIKTHAIYVSKKLIVWNDARGHMQYAQLLLKGVILGRDIEQAIFHLKKAGELGLSKGYIECGNLYRYGLYGVPRNYMLANDMYLESYHRYNDQNALLRVIGARLVPGYRQVPTMSANDIVGFADQYDPYAQFVHSELFANGLGGVSISKRRAAKYLKLSAEQGLELAQYSYAVALYKGEIVKKNIPEAAKYFKMAADQGDESSQLTYGNILFHKHDGLTVDFVEAAKYFKLAADQGVKEAQHKYAAQNASGIGIVINRAVALKYSKMAADQGVYESQALYASLSFIEDGYSFNNQETAKYSKLAADRGHAESQFLYANFVLKGDGVEDSKEAVRYFKMAADQGLASAQYEYANLAFSGTGMLINQTEAALYYKLAADQGDKEAQHKYACCSIRGDGVSINEFEAAKYFKLAADQGVRKSQFLYGSCLMHGNGVLLNKYQASKYLKMAADQGDSDAQLAYAAQCLEGDGILVDKLEAAKYLKLAADNGCQISQALCEKMNDHGQLVVKNKFF